MRSDGTGRDACPIEKLKRPDILQDEYLLKTSCCNKTLCL